MAFFLGSNGRVVFRRGPNIPLTNLNADINTDDISTVLNRVGFEKAEFDAITGDRVDLTTDDARGLAFIPASNWSSGTIQDTFSCFINVNQAGGLRLFTTFRDAVNNTRSAEISLQTFTGSPLNVTMSIRDAGNNPLGNVTSYEFNTSRDAIDTTSLTDKFKNQYNAGLISGSGTIDCSFDYKGDGVSETPLALMQVLLRLDIGSSFDAQLYLLDAEIDPSVQTIFYQINAVMTDVSVSVSADSVLTVSCSFITTGELRLVFGRPDEYILLENADRIELEDKAFEYLLKEVTD